MSNENSLAAVMNAAKLAIKPLSHALDRLVEAYLAEQQKHQQQLNAKDSIIAMLQEENDRLKHPRLLLPEEEDT
jgi:hypothetical protein